MPGFPSERFVNLSEWERNELLCSICQDVVNSPLVAQCCLQTFCRDCIHEWLNVRNTCPYDRSILNTTQLAKPPRILLNILAKLEIRCDFASNGCQEVLKLEELSQHSLKCYFGSGFCEKCFCLISESDESHKSVHNCVQSLLQLNRKSNQEIESLKQTLLSNTGVTDDQIGDYMLLDVNQYKSLMNEMKALKEENAITLERLERQEYSNSVFRESYVSHRESLKSAKEHASNPVVKKSNMSEYTKNRVLAIVREELEQGEKFNHICAAIINSLENMDPCQRWVVFYDYRDGAGFYEPVTTPLFLKVKYGAIYMEIFKFKH